jgi:hypothetical protein
MRAAAAPTAEVAPAVQGCAPRERHVPFQRQECSTLGLCSLQVSAAAPNTKFLTSQHSRQVIEGRRIQHMCCAGLCRSLHAKQHATVVCFLGLSGCLLHCLITGSPAKVYSAGQCCTAASLPSAQVMTSTIERACSTVAKHSSTR